MPRRRPKETGLGDMPDLPITPMLDMSFQLLLFLIPFFQPAPIEGQMDLNLPTRSEARAVSPQDVKPEARSDVEESLPSEVSVVVNTARDGAARGTISRIAIRTRERDIAVPSEDAKWEAFLLDQLRKIHADLGSDQQDDIQIESDGKLKYDFVIRVMDVCMRAGFKRIGLSRPPETGPGS